MTTLNLFHKTDCNITNKNGHKNDNDNDNLTQCPDMDKVNSLEKL